jgi:hypothetical protein
MIQAKLVKNISRRNTLFISLSVFFSFLLTIAIYFFSRDNLTGGIAVLILPLPVYFLYLLFSNPRISFISVFFLNYFAIGLARYIDAPVGLSVDAMLAFTWLTLIFYQFNHKINWEVALRDYTGFVVAWFIMTFFQLFNPEAISREAWFYAMRSYALYSLLTVPLVYLIFNKSKDLDLFITLLAWFTIAAIAKALMQKYIGLDYAEKRWLNMPGNRLTHLLFGQLRVFSFFSDAGTFGGSMGFFTIIFTIFGINEKKRQKKLFYFGVAIGALYALMISGTRSAVAVPLAGFVVYAFLSKKFKIMMIMGFIVFGAFFFLKYTTIGQGNYDIRRMRSAFADDNASMNVRLDNRRMFAEYLKTRPFGGGVGSAGNWGLRFSPDTFLAQTATDGWYIQIWAEQGVVGLTFYAIMILYMAFKSSIIIFFRLKKPENIARAIAFVSGLAGLMLSSYTSSALGQMPNTIIAFTAFVFISLMPQWEDEEQAIISANK